MEVEAQPPPPGEQEAMPSYVEMAQGTYIAFREFGFNWEKYPVDYGFLYARFTSFPKEDAAWMVGLVICLTVTRLLLTRTVYSPLGRWLALRPRDLVKFGESAWKFKVYSLLWAYSCHVIIFSGRHDYFLNPCRVWNFSFPPVDVAPEPMPGDMRVMYLLQMAFYLHSLYATVALDVWRKDSVMMLVHHVITIALLYFSYCVRYHKMGSLVLFLHDLSDVFLEFTKINVYLKERGGRLHRLNDLLSSCGFIVFAISWAWCRLYWFPLKVLHSTNWGAYLYHRNKDPKLFLVLNSMLFLLQALHMYWFFFILVFIYNIATGQVVSDTREYNTDREPAGPTKGQTASKSEDQGPATAVNGHSSPHLRQRAAKRVTENGDT